MKRWQPAVALAVALFAVSASAACKAVCEGYYDRCHKSCASGDRCATECEDDQQICLISCRRNRGDRGAIESDLAARRHAREKARKQAAK
jgi:hypothetical protein